MKAPRHRILMYHSISFQTKDRHLVCTSPRLFARQMEILARLGLRGVSMGEFMERGAVESGLVALTFDDGYTDFLEAAVPVLEHHGFTATVFALSGAIKENIWDHDTSDIRLALMSDGELRACAERGMEVASHGLAHERFSTLGTAELRREIFDSRDRIREITGRSVEGFCYPYGDHTPEAVRLVREAGYDYACSVEPSPGDGRFAIPRIPVSKLDAAPRFLLKLGLFWRYRSLKQHIKRRLVDR